MIQVVIGILENARAEVLVACRPDNVYLPGYWEFPGGKIEKVETPFQALQREFREEIAIDVMDASHFMSLPFEYPDKKLMLNFWRVLQYKGKPIGNEGQKIQWVSIPKLMQMPFLEANKAVLEKMVSLQKSEY